jgi:antitoxin component of MazEF toxin-antitoxin module
MTAPPRSRSSPRKVAARKARRPVSRPAPRRRTKRKATRKRVGPRGVEYRQVYSVGNSLAVTLAPACLRLLGVEHGGTVQVVPHPSGKVIIAPMRMRIGVARGLVSAAREVIELRRTVTRMRRQLQATPKRAIAQGVSIGWNKAWSAALMDLDTRVDGLTTAVRRLAIRLGDPDPPPDPSAPPPFFEGGAVASGGHPPGHPIEP